MAVDRERLFFKPVRSFLRRTLKHTYIDSRNIFKAHCQSRLRQITFLMKERQNLYYIPATEDKLTV